MGGANGYIVVYSGGSSKDVSSTETILSGLSTATLYNITIYGYKDIPSIASDPLLLLLNGKFSSATLKLFISFSSSTSQ